MQQQQQQGGGELDSPSIDYFDLRASVWDAEVGSTATLVALRLVDNWPRIWPSIDFISRKTKLSERAVRYALRELEAAGVISIESRGHNKTRRYWFLSEAGERVLIPRVGRRSAPKGGGTNPTPTGDPDDSQHESQEIESSQRQHVPQIARKGGVHLVPLPRGAALAPQGARGAPTPGHRVPPEVVTLKKSIKGGGGNARVARSHGRKRPSPPRSLITSFEGWELSDALRAELIAMGVNAAKLGPRLRRCRNRPGDLGKGVESLDEYIRELAERYWAPWDLADALSSAAPGGSSSFPSSVRGSGGPGAPKPAARIPGLPAWVYPQHVKIATAAGLEIADAAREFFEEQKRAGNPNPHHRPKCDVFDPFRRFLEARAKPAKKSRAA